MTKPTYSWPLRTVSTSVALGCKCGGFSPPRAKSRRARETPRVLSPTRSFTFTGVTLEFTGLFVSPGLSRPEKKKSSTFTSAGFLQTTPLTNTALLRCNQNNGTCVRVIFRRLDKQNSTHHWPWCQPHKSLEADSDRRPLPGWPRGRGRGTREH